MTHFVCLVLAFDICWIVITFKLHGRNLTDLTSPEIPPSSEAPTTFKACAAALRWLGAAVLGPLPLLRLCHLLDDLRGKRRDFYGRPRRVTPCAEYLERLKQHWSLAPWLKHSRELIGIKPYKPYRPRTSQNLRNGGTIVLKVNRNLLDQPWRVHHCEALKPYSCRSASRGVSTALSWLALSCILMALTSDCVWRQVRALRRRSKV